MFIFLFSKKFHCECDIKKKKIFKSILNNIIHGIMEETIAISIVSFVILFNLTCLSLSFSEICLWISEIRLQFWSFKKH